MTSPKPPPTANQAAGAAATRRCAQVERETKETRIRVAVDLDGTGDCAIATGIGFFDHMLEQVARHGAIDLRVEATGDLHIDGHHTVEDVGIALGRAVADAAGDKRGIRRYGHAFVPLDEALSRVVVDFSGRPGCTGTRHLRAPTSARLIWNWRTSSSRASSNMRQATVHVDNLRGENARHQCETIFKAFARALRMALEARSARSWSDPQRPRAACTSPG